MTPIVIISFVTVITLAIKQDILIHVIGLWKAKMAIFTVFIEQMINSENKMHINRKIK